MISGVPQGSILGPILFLLLINDLPDKISSVAKLFADDSKLYRSVRSDDDCKLLQDDLNSLAAWSNQWLMRFNEDKCVVLKIHASLNYIYTLNGTHLKEVDEQRDLGVIVLTTDLHHRLTFRTLHLKHLNDYL